MGMEGRHKTYGAARPPPSGPPLKQHREVMEFTPTDGADFVEINLMVSNAIKLVRKDAHQRDGRVQKEQKELREGKIDSKTRRRGLRLKKGV